VQVGASINSGQPILGKFDIAGDVKLPKIAICAHNAAGTCNYQVLARFTPDGENE
jgi:hypothetical protein